MRVILAVIAAVGLALGFIFWAFGPRAEGTQQAEPQAEQAQPQADQVSVLRIEGMTCGGCAAAVKMAAKGVDGVKDAVVSLEANTADVTYDASKTTADAIARAVSEKSGFTATVATQSTSER
ncbi:MAG: hypothetical protein GEV06_25145 [Luteitalea sp.]|nr:hypothetical protein [Luteitalea sp.]